MAYPSQHIDVEIPKGLRDHAFVPDTLTITLNLESESMDKISSIVNNVSRALAKKGANA